MTCSVDVLKLCCSTEGVADPLHDVTKRAEAIKLNVNIELISFLLENRNMFHQLGAGNYFLDDVNNDTILPDI